MNSFARQKMLRYLIICIILISTFITSRMLIGMNIQILSAFDFIYLFPLFCVRFSFTSRAPCLLAYSVLFPCIEAWKKERRKREGWGVRDTVFKWGRKNKHFLRF